MKPKKAKKPKKVKKPKTCHFEDMVEVTRGFFLEKVDLEKCIKSVGSLENVIKCLKYRYPKPNSSLKKLVNLYRTIKRTYIKFPEVLRENRKSGIRMAKVFGDRKGWTCKVHKDPETQEKGLLFYTTEPEEIFISFKEPRFIVQAGIVLKNKKMAKGYLKPIQRYVKV